MSRVDRKPLLGDNTPKKSNYGTPNHFFKAPDIDKTPTESIHSQYTLNSNDTLQFEVPTIDIEEIHKFEQNPHSYVQMMRSKILTALLEIDECADGMVGNNLIRCYQFKADTLKILNYCSTKEHHRSTAYYEDLFRTYTTLSSSLDVLVDRQHYLAEESNCGCCCTIS